MGHLHGPIKAKPPTEGGHGQLTDVITGQLQRAFAPNAGLGIGRKRGEPIKFFKDGQKKASGFDAVEAAEVLIVLVKAADNQLDGVVGPGDEVALDSVDQLGPVSFQEVKDGGGFAVVLDKLFP